MDLPTAVGFCMYIRRACLDRVDFLGARLDRCDLGDTTAQGLVPLRVAALKRAHDGEVSLAEALRVSE